MPRLPDKLNVDSPEASRINGLIECLRAIWPKSSATVKVTVRAQGAFFDAAAPGVNKTTNTVSGFNPRGLWLASPPSPYMTFDWVQYGTGTAGGSYYSTIDGNTNAPDSCIGWVQMATSAGTCL